MNKLVPLVATSLALGALVWFDYSAREERDTLVPPQSRSISRPNIPRDESSIADALVTEANDPVDAAVQGESDKETEGIDSTEPVNSNPLASLDKNDFSQMVERPLFAPSRRPPVAEKGNAAVKPAALADPFELMGIAKTNQQSIALIRRLTDGASFRLQVGDMIDNWMLAKIDQKSILLNRDDGLTNVVKLGATKKARCEPSTSPACALPPQVPADFNP